MELLNNIVFSRICYLYMPQSQAVGCDSLEIPSYQSLSRIQWPSGKGGCYRDSLYWQWCNQGGLLLFSSQPLLSQALKSVGHLLLAEWTERVFKKVYASQLTMRVSKRFSLTINRSNIQAYWYFEPYSIFLYHLNQCCHWTNSCDW